MSDRKLLEAAAEAAGYKHHWHHDGLLIDAQCGPWNPLTDDGDALRLAVRLGLKVWCAQYLDYCQAETPGGAVWAGGEKCPDPYAATRRAIVRAAAELGKSHDV